MTKKQYNFVASWIIGIPTLILTLNAAVNRQHLGWIAIFISGFGICRYLRRNIEIEPWPPFDYMSQKARIVSAIYYLCVLSAVLYIVLEHPHSINYNLSQVFVLLFLLVLPISPVILKRELYIFHLAGKDNA